MLRAEDRQRPMTHAPIPSDAIHWLRRASFYTFIAFLALTALIAIASVLFGEFGELELKILATTSIIAVASICCLCCAAYVGRTRNRLPGFGGISLAVLGALLVIAGIWAEANSDEYWKLSANVSIYAVAFAHALALLAVRLPRGQRWLSIAAAVVIFALASLLAGMILAEFDDEFAFRLLAVLAILAALATLVIPILGRLAHAESAPAREEAARRRLVLMEREDGRYVDREGNLYEVRAVEDPQHGSPVEPPPGGESASGGAGV